MAFNKKDYWENKKLNVGRIRNAIKRQKAAQYKDTRKTREDGSWISEKK